jgi:hypothetical protein
MATQAASATVTVNPVLMAWGSGGAGIGAYDAIEFYLMYQQTQFRFTVTSRDTYPKTSASWDLALLDQNGNELSGGGYARVNIGFAKGNFIDGGLNTVTNAVAISWSAAGTAYSIGFYDHTTGKLLQAAPLSSPVSAASGATVQFAPNSLNLYIPI